LLRLAIIPAFAQTAYGRSKLPDETMVYFAVALFPLLIDRAFVASAMWWNGR
jgi:hypothetical protein